MLEYPVIQQQLEQGLKQLNIAASDQQLAALINYLQLLEKWNKTHNLTAITDRQEMVNLHLLDSLSVLDSIKGPQLLDVGSGAGLPGLVIAVFRPDIQVTSIDTRGKKIQFQQLAGSSLGLDNFQAIHSRVEKYAAEQPFQQIISRAFSSLENFIEWTKHLLPEDGEWLAMKGQIPHEELQVLYNNHGMQPEKVTSLNVPNVDAERHLLTFKKA